MQKTREITEFSLNENASLEKSKNNEWRKDRDGETERKLNEEMQR